MQTDLNIATAVNKELVYSGIALAPTAITICPPHDSSMSTAGCPDASNRVDNWVSQNPVNYYVTVNVKYDFQLFTPLMQQLVGNPVHMSVSVQMRTNY